MNHTADQWLKDNYSGEKKPRGIFRRLMSRPFLVLGVIAVGIACLLLAAFVFDAHRTAPISWLSALKSGPKVFRKKLPVEIKIAQNLFRGKIPAGNQPVKPQTKIESIPPVEKKTVLSQPIVAPPEKSEPRREGELDQPAESQIKIEMTPPVVKTVPSQPTDASLEKSEPRGESELDRPAESQIKIDTTVLPAEEQSVPSQPTVSPSEQRELTVKAPDHQAAVRPPPIQAPAVKEGALGKTEARSIRSEKWLLIQESSYYTIQLMGARKEALLFNFVARNKLLEQNEISFYQTTYKDKPWFQLLYGVYATKKDAQSAADNLSPKIRKSSPWIRRLSAVQKTIRGKMSP